MAPSLLYPPPAWKGFQRLLAVLALAGSLRGAAQEPVFHEGDPESVSVRVLRLAEAVPGEASTLLTVRVRNGSRWFVEPLAFQATLRRRGEPARDLLLPRVGAPWHGRAGRAVPPGEELDYLLVVPVTKAEARGLDLRLLQASFFEGAVPEEAPVRAGRIDEGDSVETLQGDRIRVSRIFLENRTELEADALLLARFRNPRRGETLLRFRLQPGEARPFTVEGLPLDALGEASFVGSEVESARVVDWSLIHPDREEEARALLAAAWEGWIRWPEPAPEVHGRYSFRFEGPDPATGRRTGFLHRGSFELRGTAELRTRPDEGGREDIRLEMLLRRAFGNLRRPAFEDWLGGGRVRYHLRGGPASILEVQRPSQGGGGRPELEYFTVRDGRIQERRDEALRGAARSFRLRPTGDGWLVEGIEEGTGEEDPFPHRWRFLHEQVGGLWIPVRLEEENLFATPENDLRLAVALSGIEVRPPGTSWENRRVPEGPLAERLRRAWEEPWRYPAEPMDLSGRFVLENPGTDALWQGQRRVRGRFVLRGFRGARWDAWEIQIDGRLSERRKTELASVVEDRFRMGLWRDFAARPSFEEAFAGASLREDRGSLQVEDGPFVRVVLSGGRLRSLFLDASTERRFEWAELRGELVAAAVRTGSEEIRFHRRRVGDWILPDRIEMRGVFPDWGPEILSLEALKLRPSGK